ncbi:MAG: hypothetical protein ACOYM3_11795 [Terrimicrobiaceae bacterium]
METVRSGKILWILAVLLLSAAAILTSPQMFGLVRQAGLESATPGKGYLLSAKLPENIARPRDRMFLFPDLPVLLENGKPLPRPASQTKDIENGGWGRYRIVNGKVFFSTSAGQLFQAGNYELIASAFQVPEAVLLLLWIPGLIAAAIAIRLASFRRDGQDPFRFLRHPAWRLLPAALVAAGFSVRPGPVADLFFSGLGASVVWAIAVGILAGGRSKFSLAALIIACLLPAAASWIHYGANGFSHDSFLLAGVIPWSDAFMHFMQSAEIATQGQTVVGFNARFLFPAYFSGFLRFTALNLQAANFLVAAVVMTSLALACSALWSRIGAVGVSLFALLCWLYFRAYGCGLVMTEGLGLACGLLALAGILLGVETKKLPVLLLGLFMLTLASSSRPGALFVLPALALFSGLWAFFHIPGTIRRRALLGGATFVLSLCMVAGVFASNGILKRAFYQGEAKAFGNFAFSLNGLLTGANWNVAYEAGQGDPAPIMKANMELIRQDPMRLARGIGRAYSDLFLKAFFYRPGLDRRLAQNMLLLAGLGLAACWCLPSLRKDAPWITLAALGIFFSVPFAPPWDAEVRPYAATVPIQSLLPAIGLFAMVRLLSWISSKATEQILLQTRRSEPLVQPLSPEPSPSADRCQIPATVFACGVLVALIFPVPMIQARYFPMEKNRSGIWPPDFRDGSCLAISSKPGEVKNRIDPVTYQDRLSFFAANRPADTAILRTIQGEYLLGINWTDLKPYAVSLPLPSSPPNFLPVLSLRVEESLVPQGQ